MNTSDSLLLEHPVMEEADVQIAPHEDTLIASIVEVVTVNLGQTHSCS